MIKFTDIQSNKAVAVNESQVTFCRDITPLAPPASPSPPHGTDSAPAASSPNPVTEIHVGTSVFTVADTLDNVLADLAGEQSAPAPEAKKAA